MIKTFREKIRDSVQEINKEFNTNFTINELERRLGTSVTSRVVAHTLSELKMEELENISGGVNIYNPKMVTSAVLALAIATGCIKPSNISSSYKENSKIRLEETILSKNAEELVKKDTIAHSNNSSGVDSENFSQIPNAPSLEDFNKFLESNSYSKKEKVKTNFYFLDKKESSSQNFAEEIITKSKDLKKSSVSEKNEPYSNTKTNTKSNSTLDIISKAIDKKADLIKELNKDNREYSDNNFEDQEEFKIETKEISPFSKKENTSKKQIKNEEDIKNKIIPSKQIKKINFENIKKDSEENDKKLKKALFKRRESIIGKTFDDDEW